MTRQRYFRLALCLCLITALQFLYAAHAQTKNPEMSVAGIKLGDRASAKAFLADYTPRQLDGDDKRPAFFFYNKFGTQVLKLVGASQDDPYFITEIEVFSVGKSYQTKHYVAQKIGFFETENKIFIGYQQSVASMLIGLPGVSRNDMVGPKDVIKKKGEPTEHNKTGDDETVIYNLPDIQIADGDKTNRFQYTANYEFHKNKLKKFSFKIAPKTVF